MSLENSRCTQLQLIVARWKCQPRDAKPDFSGEARKPEVHREGHKLFQVDLKFFRFYLEISIILLFNAWSVDEQYLHHLGAC